MSGIQKIFLFLLLVGLIPALVFGVTFALRFFFPFLPWWLPIVSILPVVGGVGWWVVIQARSETVVTKRELELMASQEKFMTLYERSPVPYVTTNEAGVVLTANLAAVRLFQTATDAIAGLDLFQFIDISDENEAAVVMGKVSVRVPVVDVEAQIVTARDEKKWIMLSMYPYASGSETLVSMVDITHQKIVDIAKSEFVALATHQLRTPVAAIRWNVELLRRNMIETLTESEDKYLIKIERNVLRMIALINDFLSVSKLETGTFATDFTSISLGEQFDAVADEFMQAITEKRIVFKKEYIPTDAEFITDTRLFHIITSNLISNAVKYVGEEATITVGYECSSEHLTIVIADSGIGIPAQEVEKLFTKFYRASNAQAHRAEGTGLGLYIVKQSVEKLGGTITVASVENQGTTFTVKLPMHQ